MAFWAEKFFENLARPAQQVKFLRDLSIDINFEQSIQGVAGWKF